MQYQEIDGFQQFHIISHVLIISVLYNNRRSAQAQFHLGCNVK